MDWFNKRSESQTDLFFHSPSLPLSLSLSFSLCLSPSFYLSLSLSLSKQEWRRKLWGSKHLFIPRGFVPIKTGSNRPAPRYIQLIKMDKLVTIFSDLLVHGFNRYTTLYTHFIYSTTDEWRGHEEFSHNFPPYANSRGHHRQSSRNCV